VALLLALGLAAPAAADPVTFPEPGGTAAVTLSTADARPGEQIGITGTGFVRAAGGGHPWIALKVNDVDLPWTYGGDSRIDGSPTDAAIWFEASDTGTFSGWIEVPEDFTAPGPGVGENAGKHGLRILSGAFSDDTLSATRPITYQAFFAVTPRATLGVTGPNGTTFQAGNVFRPGVQYTIRGTDFAPEEDVSMTLDGADLPTDARTDTAGTILGSDATNRFTIPAGTPPGAHDLRISTGTTAETHRVRVTAAPTATIENARVRPGGLVGFRFDGFVGVAGAGQKVAVVSQKVVDGAPVEVTLACVQASPAGTGSGVVALPENPAGPVPVRFVAGTSCVGPTGAQDDLPATFVSRSTTVADDAPNAVVPDSVPAGQELAVSGSGFAPGTSVVVTMDDGPAVATLNATESGAVSGRVAIPLDAPVGDRVLRLTSGPDVALARFAVAEPVVEEPPGSQPEGPTTTVPTTTTPADTTPAPPATTTTPAPAPSPAPGPATVVAPKLRSLKVGRTTLRLTLGGQQGRSVKVTVKSTKRIRVTARGKARVVTFASATTTKVGTVSVRLTKDGRAALKRLRKVRVVVRLAPKGGKAVTKTITLRA
jgi:hypothetical protein